MNNSNQRFKSAVRRVPLIWAIGMLALLAVLSLAIRSSADSPPASLEKEAQSDTRLVNSLVKPVANFENRSAAAASLFTTGSKLPTGFSFQSLAPNSIVKDQLDASANAFDCAPPRMCGYLPMVIRTVPAPPPPSGYLLAFDTKPADNYEIYVIQPDGTNARDISNLADGDLDPTWSPDGTKVAWEHYDSGRGEIYSVKFDGTARANLTNNDKDDRNPDWSPDGTKIAFDTYRDGSWEIYVMNTDGSNQQRLTSNLCQSHDPLWSPDGTRIAFICGLDNYSEVYVMNANGSGTTRLTYSKDLEDAAIAWAPDSIHIAYIEYETRKNPEIYVVNANTGGPTRLTNNTYYEFAPDWSPDGSRIAFSTNRTGNYEIFTMAPDGSNPVNITQATGADYVPRWSPDGTQISFVSTRDGNKELYVMNANGTNQLRLTTTANDEIVHVWQPVKH